MKTENNDSSSKIMLCCFCGLYFLQSNIATHIKQCLILYSKLVQSSIKFIFPTELNQFANKLYSNIILSQQEIIDYNTIANKHHQSFQLILSNMNNLTHQGRLFSRKHNYVKQTDYTFNLDNEYIINKNNNGDISCPKCSEIFKISTFLITHLDDCIKEDYDEISINFFIILSELYSLIISSKDEKDYIKYLLSEFIMISQAHFINAIMCHICNATVSLKSYEIHYSNCKMAMKFSKSNPSNLILKEPEILQTILSKLENDEMIPLKMLKEYTMLTEKLSKEKNRIQCSKWGKKISSDFLPKHITNCNKRRRLLSKDNIHSLAYDRYYNNSNRKMTTEIFIKKNRKQSMEHLKKITNEEVTKFTSINIKGYKISHKKVENK